MTKVTHLTLNEGGGLSRKRIHLREISGDTDLPLETVGQDLRAARLRRGDDLATASKALKIRKDHLEALEEDRFKSLPGRTYAIGFVRSYADYLGLDALESVERFKREIAGRDETPQSPAFHDEDEGRRLPHGWVVIAVVVLGLVVYGAYRLALSADTLLSEPVAPVPARMTSPAEEHAPEAVAQPSANGTTPGATQPGPKAGATTQPAISGDLIAPEDGTQNAVVPPSSGVPETVNGPPTPKGQVYGRQNTNARVVLHAIQPTRVLVEGTDGVVYISRTLHAGDSYRVPDRVGLTLTTSNAGALEVVLDGQRMGTAGRKRRMAEAVLLDPQAIVDRYYGRHTR